jgi:hypothetical protein
MLSAADIRRAIEQIRGARVVVCRHVFHPVFDGRVEALVAEDCDVVARCGMCGRVVWLTKAGGTVGSLEPVCYQVM